MPSLVCSAIALIQSRDMLTRSARYAHLLENPRAAMCIMDYTLAASSKRPLFNPKVPMENTSFILELNVDLGQDPARIGDKVTKITSWLNYRRPLNAAVFGMRVIDVGVGLNLTLVARVAYKCTKGLAGFEDLAADLKEECIAVWDVGNRTGYLIGPNRLTWGSFDMKKFTRFK